MKRFQILARFSVYGFLTFIAFGYLLNNSYVSESPTSLNLMLYLGLAGAISFPLSAGAILALKEIFKELMQND